MEHVRKGRESFWHWQEEFPLFLLFMANEDGAADRTSAPSLQKESECEGGAGILAGVEMVAGWQISGRVDPGAFQF